MAPGSGKFPKGILLLIVGAAVVLILALGLNRRGVQTASPETDASEEASASEPKITRSHQARPAPDRSPRSRPAEPPTDSAAETPPPDNSIAPEPDGDSPPYVTDDMLSLDDSYDPDVVFKEAGEEFNVPPDLLKAIAYVESKGNHQHGQQTEDGGYGVMHLRERSDQNSLADAAKLLGTEKKVLVRDPAQNIRGAAALLRSFYDQSASTSWLMAVSLYSGRAPEQAVEYAREIENILQEGLSYTLEGGQLLYVNPGQGELVKN